MDIRKGTDADLPAIVNLLKASLGEGLIQKTIDLWKWKHILNPHGASPVLVAVEDNEIVGVRAFLKWQWQYNGQKLTAVRAVDTATHPNFQGKGIFKKLTLKGLEDAAAEGVQFVYNTPNENSKPGYLKMGWVTQGQMPLKLKIDPFAFKNFSVPAYTTEDTAQLWKNVEVVLNNISNPLADSGAVHTALSPEYIKWRYKENPLFNYFFITDNSSFLLFYRYKEHKFGLECRVVDFFIDTRLYNDNSKKILKGKFKKISKGCFLISVSGRHFDLVKNAYPSMGLLPTVNKGPIVTLRNLTLDDRSFDVLKDVSQWGYSIGDMELF